MSLELKIGERNAKINILEHEGSRYKVQIDSRTYDLDIEKVESNAYSILMDGKSLSIEMVEGATPNQYNVNTIDRYYEIEILDAVSRYRARAKSQLELGGNIISTPMPGKIVKILVAQGDTVEKDQTVIIVSAMKMESEYKCSSNGIVKAVHVSEGNAVEGNQPLIEIEAS